MSEAPFKCVYVLCGPDVYLRRQARRRIARNFTGEADPQLVVTSLDASAELSEVLDALRTPPLTAPRRLVIVDQADEFVTAHRQSLEKYLSRPATRGSLMLVVNSWPGNTRLAKLTRRIGEVIDCSAPGEGELPRWIPAAAERHGKRIADDAADLLAAWIGSDLARLDSEIEKLAIYLGPRRAITADDVEAVVVATAEAARYALSNAIRDGDVPAALEALNKMLTRRGEEFRVLGLIGWQLRRQRSGPARGRSELRRGFRRLLRADLAMKTGADPRTAVQVLVTQLCLQAPPQQ